MKQTLQSGVFTIFRLSRDRRHSPDARKVGVTSHFRRPLNTVAFGIALLLSPRADGAELKSMSLYEQAKTLSADPKYKWTGAVGRTDSTGSYTASGVAIAPDVFINSGHYTPRDGSATARLTTFKFGANYNTSFVSYDVDHTQRFPSYVFGDTTTIDLGIGWTSTFFAGFSTTVTFGSIGLGSIGTMVDYGNIGDPTTGELPSLGDRMAGYTPRIIDSASSYPESRYDSFDFNGVDSLGIALNVFGKNYSSGAPFYNSNGDLTHIAIAGTLSTQQGASVGLELMNPEIQAVLQPIIQDSWNRYNASIPEPSSIGLFAAGSLLALQRRRRG